MNVQAVISDARNVLIPHIMSIRQDIRMNITIVKRPLASFDPSQDMDYSHVSVYRFLVAFTKCVVVMVRSRRRFHNFSSPQL